MGKALYYKPTREQNETSTFGFDGITQNLWQSICYKGYICLALHIIISNKVRKKEMQSKSVVRYLSGSGA